MRTRFRSRTRRRAKRRYIWTGLQFGSSSTISGVPIPDAYADTGPQYVALIIAGPQGETPLTTATDLLVQRVLMGFVVNNNSLLDSIVNCSVEVAHTNLDEDPLTTPPNFDDGDALQKREPMWMGAWFVPAGSTIGTAFGPQGLQGNGALVNNGLPLEIKSKRKLTGDDSLIVKWTGQSTVGEVESELVLSWLWTRALISGGRR